MVPKAEVSEQPQINQPKSPLRGGGKRTGYGWFDRKFIVRGVYYPAIIDRELNRPKARTRERAEGIKPTSNNIRSAKNFFYQYF
jgi:hypothetical protein